MSLLNATAAVLAAFLSSNQPRLLADSGPTSETIDLATRVAFVLPAAGPVTSRYGPRWGRMHAGTDIGAAQGSPIVSSEAATVAEVGYDARGYGNYAVLTGETGSTETLYGHAQQILVKTGQSVAQGELIGLVGSSGRSTGPHLHFEVAINGKRVDPETVLNKQKATPMLKLPRRTEPVWANDQM